MAKEKDKKQQAMEAAREIGEVAKKYNFDVALDAITAFLASVVVSLDPTGERDLFAAVTDRFTKSYITGRMAVRQKAEENKNVKKQKNEH